jgi:hypothetical protein
VPQTLHIVLKQSTDCFRTRGSVVFVPTSIGLIGLGDRRRLLRFMAGADAAIAG